jgi:hypothetical protein
VKTSRILCETNADTKGNDAIEGSEFYKKGCQGKEMGIDRSQEDFLRSSPLRLGEAVLPFLFSFASLVRAGNAIELERAASQGG